MIDEFNKKYKDTVILINQRPVFIVSAGEHGIYTYDYETEENQTTEWEDIISIEKLKPEAGVYKKGNTILYLFKTSKRQWLKSFCEESNYSIQLLETDGKNNVLNTIINPDFHSSSSLFIIDSNVFLKDILIGKIIYGTRICLFTDIFVSEVKNKWPNFLVIALNQIQSEEEKQKLLKLLGLK